MVIALPRMEAFSWPWLWSHISYSDALKLQKFIYLFDTLTTEVPENRLFRTYLHLASKYRRKKQQAIVL